jgi:hypothetical protein
MLDESNITASNQGGTKIDKKDDLPEQLVNSKIEIILNFLKNK